MPAPTRAPQHAPQAAPTTPPVKPQPAPQHAPQPVPEALATPTVLYNCVATHNFEPTNATMMAVTANDKLEVLESHESGWAYARNLSQGSAVGWVPNWVAPKPVAPAAPRIAPQQAAQQLAAQVVAPPSQTAAEAQPTPAPAPTRPVVEATAVFAGREPSQLSLTPKDLVEIIERHSSGWTFGRKVGGGSLEGWFPDWACA